MTDSVMKADLHVDIAHEDDVEEGAVVVVACAALSQGRLCVGVQVAEVYFLCRLPV